VNLLNSLPEGAVVLAQSDDLVAGTTYAQTVLGVRADVVLVSWAQTPLRWYRERLAARGVAIDPYAPGSDPASVRVADQILASGRPLFVEFALGNVLRAFTTYPSGTVFRVLPRGAPQLPLDDIIALNKRLYAKFDLDEPNPGPDDGYPTGVYHRYAKTWAIIARALADSGRRDEAKAAAELAHQLAPGS